MSVTKTYRIIRCDSSGRMPAEDPAVVEYQLNLFLNGEEFVSLLCTPKDLEVLVVGYLYSEGIIHTPDQLEEIRIDEEAETAHVTTRNRDKYQYKGNNLFGTRTVTTACGGQRSIPYRVIEFLGVKSDEIKKQIQLRPEQILSLAARFNKSSDLFLSTGGVHSCALCNQDEILLLEEDIGRHNALDKILGKALKGGIPFQDKIVLTSGRITEEMVRKVIRAQIPVLVSRSAPTDAAIEMARNLNLTLIGFARGNRMNIYSNEDKIDDRE